MERRRELMKANTPNASCAEEMAINDNIAELDRRLADQMRMYREYMYPEETNEGGDFDDDSYSDYSDSDYSDY